MATDAKPPAEPAPQIESNEDAEAAAVWARLAPHAKKSFAEALDDYFAEGGESDAGTGPGGTAAAGGAGDGADGDAAKTRPKAQGQGSDIVQQVSDFFFGKPRKA